MHTIDRGGEVGDLDGASADPAAEEGLYAFDVDDGPSGVAAGAGGAAEQLARALLAAPVGAEGLIRRAELSDMRGGAYRYGDVLLRARREPDGLVWENLGLDQPAPGEPSPGRSQ